MYSELKVRKVDQIPEYLLSCKFQKNIYIYIMDHFVQAFQLFINALVLMSVRGLYL